MDVVALLDEVDLDLVDVVLDRLVLVRIELKHTEPRKLTKLVKSDG